MFVGRILRFIKLIDSASFKNKVTRPRTKFFHPSIVPSCWHIHRVGAVFLPLIDARCRHAGIQADLADRACAARRWRRRWAACAGVAGPLKLSCALIGGVSFPVAGGLAQPVTPAADASSCLTPPLESRNSIWRCVICANLAQPSQGQSESCAPKSKLLRDSSFEVEPLPHRHGNGDLPFRRNRGLSHAALFYQGKTDCRSVQVDSYGVKTAEVPAIARVLQSFVLGPGSVSLVSGCGVPMGPRPSCRPGDLQTAGRPEPLYRAPVRESAAPLSTGDG